ncbi:DNA-binding transcriptional regulator, LysR family [Promicromonospora umidemergens]|uniref:LysR family transcriptional regulator n=1 Tax=Promicromonospora umidemergens TaxID=629679 RepID=A0ABP8XJR1_9MICO|nr:LysR family transcriptional regulator [Promicromonospora umidemergens]MCP2282171.1 DNA-binding transcriptional regulator, LysR family [Promicromonospora umidemergens]
MELREIEIFLTLAEELHFGRTADRLHLSQARVSQAIKKHERSIGAQLFHRTSRVVRLTPLGERLRNDLRPLLRGINESTERARLIASGRAGVLRVGTTASNTLELRPFWDAFRAEHPDWDLRVRYQPFSNAIDVLRRGDIHVFIGWLPVTEPDLTAGPVMFTEPMVVALSPDHDLAARDAVNLEDLAAFAVIDTADALPLDYIGVFNPFQTPRGRDIGRGPVAGDVEQIFDAIANGEIAQPLSGHAARYHLRPDVIYRPFRQDWTVSWGPIWRTENENAGIRALAAVLSALGPREL